MNDGFIGDWLRLSAIPTVDAVQPRTWDYTFNFLRENGQLFFIMEEASIALRSANTGVPLRILGANEQLVMKAPAAGLRLNIPHDGARVETELPVQFLLEDFPEINTPQSNVEKRRLLRTKIGRNESCPCGSGKKYKKCHGKV